MSSDSYRDLKEKFVSNLQGTTVFDIALVVSIAPASVLLKNVFMSWVYKGCHPKPAYKFLIDFLFLIMPVLCGFTVMSSHIEGIYSAMGFAVFAVMIFSEKVTSLKPSMDQPISWNSIKNIEVSGKQPFISAFRAYVNIATAISILAVDFMIFPRRYAKAETFGTGLMDVGVGAFVISNAIVSPEARGKHLQTRSLKSKLTSVFNSVLSTMPLWILGLARMAAVKSTDYQEHVSEYGVHWNFFFTLAVVRILSTLVLCLADPSWSWLLSLVIGVGYQYLLSILNYEEYVLFGSDGHGSRGTLFEANREGIFSCLGYLSIYFAGVQLGRYILKARSRYSEWLHTFVVLIVLDLVFWILLYYCELHIEQVSRRLANLPFILWMMAYNLQLLPLFLFVDLFCILAKHVGLLCKDSVSVKSHSKFCLLEAVNQNGLFYFLLANVFTGLVNFSMETLYVKDSLAFLIMVIHMFVLSAIAGVLFVRKTTLKFW